jgi:hypothetical protein
MNQKKDFKSLANKLISVVDFVKWTSSFGLDSLQQMEIPAHGVRLTACTSELFALTRDDIGWMLTMTESEGRWLENLPLEEAFIGYGQELILITKPIDVFEQTCEPIAIGIFVPAEALRTELQNSSLLGFALCDAQGNARRVNRLIPISTPEQHEAKRLRPNSSAVTKLFSL